MPSVEYSVYVPQAMAPSIEEFVDKHPDYDGVSELFREGSQMLMEQNPIEEAET